MGEEARRLFSRHRVRCWNCSTDFCTLCLAFPYHRGLSCADYLLFKAAPKCQFCPSACAFTRQPDLKEDVVYDLICHDSECAERRRRTCLKPLACGHLCIAAVGEECMPCLADSCRPEELKQGPHDICTLCYTDELCRDTCLLLQDCGHVFHLDCIGSSIRAKWSSRRVNFKFIRCPLCDTPITHIAHKELSAEVAKAIAFKTLVEKAALRQLKIEKLETCKEITDPASCFHQRPVDFAMSHFSFYRCFDCRRPYCAGAARCDPGPDGDDEQFNEEDLMCPRCALTDEQCLRHGTDGMSFKCRFCCSLAVWFCFGTTHFCDKCHRRVRELTLHRENRLPVWEYPQCPGLKAQVELHLVKVNKKYTLSDERVQTMRSDRSSCPLGIRHPLNGIEFSLGCKLCVDAPAHSSDSECDSGDEKAEFY